MLHSRKVVYIKKGAEQARTGVIGQLYSNTYVVYDNVANGGFSGILVGRYYAS